MRSIRISRPARADLQSVLKTSLTLHGPAAQERYRALLALAIEAIAEDPFNPATRERADIHPELRSLHLRALGARAGVGAPVHAIFFRDGGERVEIIRVLHERMDPHRHLPGTG